MAHRPYVLFIYGPTGVGKTDFALQISKECGWKTEIINMDVGQFYRPLSVGTAKPNSEEQSLVPHHLFDCIDTPVNFTVTEYRSRVMRLVHDITTRGNLPIIAGGSGFYLKSLFFNLEDISQGVADSELSGRLNEENTWHLLNDVDPARARAIHPNDQYRIDRALTVWRAHGVLPSAQEARGSVPWDCSVVFLWRDRPELYDRINQRVEMMMDQGWLSEVAGLQGSAWEEFIAHKKLIGYHELFQFLKGSQSPYEYRAVVSDIQTKTRHYAKRQLTFWKFLSRSLQSLIEEYQLRHGMDRMTLESITIGTMDIQRSITEIVQRYRLNTKKGA